MRFALALPMLRHLISPTELPKLALKAEELGFDSVWTADHIAVPKANSETYGDVVEQMVTLTYIAAKTKTLKVGTSVTVLPQRDPMLVAKQAAALNVLSGGRLILGVGAGWVEGEFQILGADFAHRGKILDEAIRLMRVVWSDPVINFSGKYFTVRDAVSFPKPSSEIPIWIGGNSDAAIRRAARLGDGWHSISIPPSRIREGLEVIKQSGRKVAISHRSMVNITDGTGHDQPGLVGTPSQIVKRLEEYKESGVDLYLLQSGAESAELVSRDVSAFAKEFLHSF
jgi:probable F420-dependent oxidoreductase